MGKIWSRCCKVNPIGFHGYARTDDDKAQTAVTNLVSLLRTGSVQFLEYPCLDRTSISSVPQILALLREL